MHELVRGWGGVSVSGELLQKCTKTSSELPHQLLHPELIVKLVQDCICGGVVTLLPAMVEIRSRSADIRARS